MERSVALKTIRKLLGNPKDFGYQIDPKAAGPDERAAAKTEHETLAAMHKQVSDKAEARRKLLLDQDTLYQELIGQSRSIRKQRDEASAVIYRRRFTVGTSNSLWFSVKASGDSWEEIIEKLKKEKSTV